MNMKKCEFDGRYYQQGAECCTRTRCFKCDKGTMEKSVDPGREKDFFDWL